MFGRHAWSTRSLRLVATAIAVALFITALSGAIRAKDDDEIPSDAVQVQFVRIIDGDTFVVDFDLGPDQDLDRIRLIGIDTPEVRYDYGNRPECYGHEATYRTESLLVSAQEIWVERDVSPVDKADRLLRYVWYVDPFGNVRFLNEQLVEEGYALARHYPPNLHHQDRLDAAQDRAISEGRGMWTACDASVSLDPDLEPNRTPDRVPIDRTATPITDTDEQLACSFFDRQDQAQDFLDAFPDLAELLDPDGNGIACDGYFTS